MITGSDKAYRDALFNVARFGASRFGAFSSRAFITIGGVPITDARDDAWDPGILRGSLTVRDLLDDAPNTASFSAWNFKPDLGAEVVITLGSKHNAARVFAGHVLSVNQVYLSKPVNRVFQCSCIDYTWRLMQTKAFAFYQNTSATTIVRDLLARFAPTVSDRYVQAGLPTVAEMTITNEDVPSVLKRVAQRVGAYFYVDYSGALHFYTTEPRQNPAPIVPSHRTLSAVEYERDLSQIVTRVLSEGGGGNTLTPIAIGAAVIPVDVGSWYAAAGGYVTIGPNRVRYTGLQGIDETGTLIGPGVTPSTAPTLAAIAGGTLPVGAYQYAYTFQTAAGETRPSPIASASSGVLPAPTVAPDVFSSPEVGSTWTPNPSYAGFYSAGATVEMAYSYSLDGSMTGSTSGPLSPIVTRVAVASPYSQNGVPVPWAFHVRPPWIDAATQRFSYDPNVKFLHLWWRVNGGPWYLKAQNTPNPNTGGGNSLLVDLQVTAVTPPTAGPTVAQIQLSNIAVGPATVTNRKIYRTAVNGSQLKLLTTLAGNASSGPLTDTAADATLGANAPVGDTSGLAVATGQVNPGATTVIVAGAAWANPGGGWAVIGNGRQVISYTGTTPGSLTGVPASGVGAVVAAVPYNSSITAAPLLTGIPASGDGAVRWSVAEGERVNVLSIADDVSAQGVLRSLAPGHSGIIEEYLTDGRLSLAEATARGAALLASKAAPLVTVRYKSRDVTTASGATVTVDLPPPTDIHETLKLQAVTIDGFNISPTTDTPPSYHATASSDRYSFDDLLRQLRAGD